jgi:hypothetical protein
MVDPLVPKARDPKSPEREIQAGLNFEYDGLSKLILSLTHSNSPSALKQEGISFLRVSIVLGIHNFGIS